MEGIAVVRLVIDESQNLTKEFITNLTALRKKIIHLFGPNRLRYLRAELNRNFP